MELNQTDRLAMLRVPFESHEISKLPKMSKKQKEDKANYVSCKICGGWHHEKAVHLDYVGHAALTARLLDVDPMWGWEPCTDNGIPTIDEKGGMWIRLTICGVSRLGYGHAEGNNSFKSSGDLVKEVIGDALRNAAMRFGAALDLWDKNSQQSERHKRCSEVLREHFNLVSEIKDALAIDDFDMAAEAFGQIPDEDRAALGLATTKGGIYTIEESHKFKDERWGEARARIIQSTQAA